MEAALGLLGILVGIAAKWVVDLITDSRRFGREDRLRFLADKPRSTDAPAG